MLTNNLRDIKNDSEVYQSTARFLHTTLLKNSDGKLRRLIEKLGSEDRELLNIIAGDSYYTHYLISPLLEDENPHPALNKLLEALKEYVFSGDYQSAHSLTMLDHELSTTYAVALTKKLVEKLFEKQQQSQQGGSGQDQGKQGEEEKRGQGGAGGQQQQQRRGASKSRGKNRQGGVPSLASVIAGMGKDELKKIVKESVEYAKQRTERAKTLRQVMGGRAPGTEPGTLTRMALLEPKAVRIDVVLQMTGRILYSLKTRGSGKLGWLGESLRGYTITRSIYRAVPRDLALPDDLFLYKLSSGFTARVKETPSAGTIFVALDKSGSMSTCLKTEWSRAVALALFFFARKKGMKYKLMFFDAYPHQVVEDPVSVYEMILSVACDGGTDISRALYKALQEVMSDEGEGTIVLISDGESHIDPDLHGFFEKVKKKVSLIAIMIDGHNPWLQKLAEKYGQYLTVTQDVDGALRLIEAVKFPRGTPVFPEQ